MWVLRLHTEVALSLFHSEYVALSQSMKDYLPLKTLCVDVIKGLGLDPEKMKHNTKSKLFEDKDGALKVDKCPRINHGSKSIAVKYHWLCENIQNGECTVENIYGDVQKPDIFTKVLQG